MEGHQENHAVNGRETEDPRTRGSSHPRSQSPADDWSWVDGMKLGTLQFSSESERQPRHAHETNNNQQFAFNFQPPQDVVQIQPQQLQKIRSTAQFLNETLTKLSTVRDEVMLLRDQGIYERQRCSEQRRFFIESQNALLDMATSPVLAQSIPVAKDSNLIELQHRLRHDGASVEIREQETLHVETEILKKEYSLREREAALAQASQELLAALGHLADVGSEKHGRQALPPEISVNRQHITPTPTPPIPAPLEEYYERSGVVGWTRDRLVEAQTEYQESRVARLFRKDHEEQLEISDEEFEAEYGKRILDAQQALEMARARAEEAWEFCIIQGLDPDGHRKQGLQEVPEISFLPFTPEDEPQDLALPPRSPPTILQSALSERNQSSTMLTNTTGPMNLDAAPRRRRKREPQRNRSHIHDWIQSNRLTEQYPFEGERFEEYPTSRPIAPSRRSFNGSIDDLLDNTIIGPEIGEKLPQQLQEHSQSEPNIFRSRGNREQIRNLRPLSESRIEEYFKQKGSQQKSREETYRDLMSNRASQESKDPYNDFPEFGVHREHYTNSC